MALRESYTRMTKQKPTKISLFGHFGTMNFGNEATLLVMVSRLRLLFPNCEFCCICTSPENVIATHGIEAVPHTVRSVRIWDRQVPLGKRLRMATLGLSEEIREYIRAWRTLKGTDMFIIPGTGLLTDAFGCAGWGPYGVFKWSLIGEAAPLQGDVRERRGGSGPQRAGTILREVGAFARRLQVVSRRPEQGGRRRHRRSHEGRPNLPGSRFWLVAPMPPTAAVREGRPVVGLGLMGYSGKYSIAIQCVTLTNGMWSHRRDRGLVARPRLRRQAPAGGRDVDTLAIDDLRAVLRERLASDIAERVTDHPIGSVQELLSQLSATDLVVATRFHNILMSLLLGKPVVAISFHHKCSSLMSDMGLSEYCHDINQMNADTLIEQFQALVQQCRRSHAHDRAASRGSANGPGRAVRSAFR